ncbi:MAG: hypothetical protein ICV51_15335 [Flavisolibacter sp.]|nr:hypothetical protein [Flavisolibacter sp.]
MKPFEETGFTHRTIKQGLWIIIPICLIMSVIDCKKHADQPANVTPNLTLVADSLVSSLSVVEPPDDTKRLFIF